VKRWIESLPPEATFETGRQLCRQLATLNRVKLEGDARLEILEAFEPAVTPMLQELEPMYAKAPLPLAPAARAALGLARELLTELAMGYRIAAVEMGGKLFGAKKTLTAILFRAMRFTTARMFAAYKSYTPAPAGTWAELHEIYIRAEQLGIAREPGDSASKATLADFYGEALLLSLTDPYRLNQGESERVLQLLRSHRGLATLGQARPRTSAGGHFLVPCNADKPPKPSIGKLDETDGPDWRLLDANPIVDALRAQLASGTAKTEAPPALLAKLATLWGDPPKRTSRRDPGQETVAITMGIDGVGHFVAMESRVNLERQDEMLRNGITMPLVPMPLDDASQPIPVFEWDVVNQSRGGLRVRRTERTEQPIAVGEVAGIKMPGKPRWAIGVVRWVTVFEDGGMEFGLQYLAAMARAVLVKTWGSPSAAGLLLSTEEAPAATLLTTPKLFQPQRALELEDGDEAWLVQADEVVETTRRFEMFTVKAS
jgi:cyclic-di-GMP-binding protein